MVPVQSVPVKVRMSELSWGSVSGGMIDSWEIKAGHTLRMGFIRRSESKTLTDIRQVCWRCHVL